MQLSVISCRKVTDNQGSTGHVDAVPRMSHFQAFCENKNLIIVINSIIVLNSYTPLCRQICLYVLQL